MAKPQASASAKKNGDETVAPTAAHGLDRAINVLALMLVKGMKKIDAIDLLDKAGFEAREIAALLATSPNAVSVALYQAKKNGKKAKGKRGED